MKIFKSLAAVVTADILSLFISFTLASSSSVIIRIISVVCSVGILICFLGSFSVKAAKEEVRLERVNDVRMKSCLPFAQGIMASMPALISWIALFISHKSGSFYFYRWHKLINSYFLQIYNFINSDAKTSALTTGQIMLMLVFVFVPMIGWTVPFMFAYYKEKKGRK